MAAGSMHGVAVYYDGSEHPYRVGTSDVIRTNRQYPTVNPDKLADEPLAVEYVSHLVFTALQRQGDVVNIGFGTWIDSLDDLGTADDEDAAGESPAPPTE